MATQGNGGAQRRRLGILLAYHPPAQEEGGSRREKWGAGLSQLGFGLGKILNSEPSAGSIAGIGHSPHVVQEVAKEGAAAGLLRPGDEIAALDGKVATPQRAHSRHKKRRTPRERTRESCPCCAVHNGTDCCSCDVLASNIVRLTCRMSRRWITRRCGNCWRRFLGAKKPLESLSSGGSMATTGG
eukprot:Tamp_16246.p1 GENE.Tamp_16246~~Tamp_16246.p1  ORF type:complete len:185 (-),score=15.31 Tamp_16246:777-1331(-)